MRILSFSGRFLSGRAFRRFRKSDAVLCRLRFSGRLRLLCGLRFLPFLLLFFRGLFGQPVAARRHEFGDASIEADIEAIENRIAEIEVEMNENGSDFGKLSALQKELEAIQRGIEDIKQGRTFKMRKDESLDDFLNRIEDECNV